MQAPDFTPARMSAWRTILFGGAVVATLDGLDAILVWGLRGVSPARVFQGVATGLYGRSSFAGGATTALIGVAIHVFIACCVVATYYLAATRLQVLRRHPVISGVLYGLAVYVVMYYVVIPMSAAGGGGRPQGLALMNAVGIHILGVGLPTALIVRCGFPGPSRSIAAPPASPAPYIAPTGPG